MLKNKLMIKEFKTYNNKTRYEVRTPMHFLGGGFASIKSAEKYMKKALKNKELRKAYNY